MSMKDPQQPDLGGMTNEELDTFYLQLQQRRARIRPKMGKEYIELTKRLVAIMKVQTRRRRQRGDGEQGEG